MVSVNVPSLIVSDFKKAEEFYCKRLGFRRTFITRSGQGALVRCFMTLERDEAFLNISKPFGVRPSNGKALILVNDLGALFVEFTTRGVEIDYKISDQSTGNRLMSVSDADGNRLEFLQLSKRKRKVPSKRDLLKEAREKLLGAQLPFRKKRRY